MKTTKPFDIPKGLVVKAYRQVKANKGSAGVDGQSLYDFEKDLNNNLYKLWNRLSSGSYHPSPVKRVEIEKLDGSVRPLGIPTVTDRIAQTVVKRLIERELESHFHPDSYGYRPGKSAHQALRNTLERSREKAWVLDMDIQGFFDNIDHSLLMKAVDKHVKEAWIKLYIYRWLTVPVQYADGRLGQRTRGTPQGGVVSPLLANLFLHYVFDAWMSKHYPAVVFERYADDIVCHCGSEFEVRELKSELEHRFQACGLMLHPEKTKLVYCKSQWRRGRYPTVSFDFLGFTFGPRYKRTKGGGRGVYFMAMISRKASKRIREQIKGWPWRYWYQCELEEINEYCQNKLRGWMNYYGLFGKHYIREILFHFDKRLRRWSMNKYKELITVMRAAKYVNELRKTSRNLFSHWGVAAKG